MRPQAARLRRWIDDPVRFAVDELHVPSLDPWQIDILRAFPHKQRLAMKACKGPGKTAVLAWCSWNFLATRPDAKIVATSITGDNLDDNLWPEMSKWQQKSDYLKTGFEWKKTRIECRETPENWFMSARTWARGADKQRQADALAGTHADYVMFVLDEAGGIPDAVAATAEGGLASGIETKLIIAGNPTNLEGPLYRACTSQSNLWFTVEITGDPGDPKRSSRVSIQWAKDQIATYGKDNPWVLVNVFGKFPPSSLNVLLGPDEVEAAMDREIEPVNYEFSQKRLGVDVARQGDDRTYLFPRQGLRALLGTEMRNADGPQVASRIALAKERWGWEICCMDNTGGFGSSAIDAARQADMEIIPVDFSGKADDSRYFNKRAEMHFRMAQWVKGGGWLPRTPTIKRELTAPTFTFHNGKFQIEDKKQIKERLGFSPDEADALCLTFAIAELPRGDVGAPFVRHDAHKVKSDWNPFEDIQEPRRDLDPEPSFS